MANMRRKWRNLAMFLGRKKKQREKWKMDVEKSSVMCGEFILGRENRNRKKGKWVM